MKKWPVVAVAFLFAIAAPFALAQEGEKEAPPGAEPRQGAGNGEGADGAPAARAEGRAGRDAAAHPGQGRQARREGGEEGKGRRREAERDHQESQDLRGRLVPLL